MKKSSFYWSMLKYSIIHPIEIIDIIKISKDVKNEKNSKPDYKLNLDINSELKKLFGKYDTNNEKNELETLKQFLEKKIREFGNEEFPSKKKPYPTDYSLNSKEGSVLYEICRILKPEIVVETGVAYGISSAHILLSLKSNQKGKLFSIDSTFRPWETKEMIGVVIPDYLKKNWSLIFGKSRKKLKKTLSKLKKIDIFFHDSLHTYKNMIFEFETVWPYLKNGGILISDDIISNNAFKDFVNAKNGVSIVLGDENWSLGIIKKIE